MGADVPKVGCLTPSVLLSTSEGDWTLTSLSLGFPWTGPQEASTGLRSAMFCINLVKRGSLTPEKASYTQQ